MTRIFISPTSLHDAGGAVNIELDGHTIGAVGISGLKNMEDTNTSKAGIAAIIN